MTDKRTQAHGTWSSPLTPARMGAQLRLSDVAFAEDGTLVWQEGRSGDSIIVARYATEAEHDVTDLTRKPGGGVGYGGGSLTVHGRAAVFADRDGRIYAIDLRHGEAKPVTPSFGSAASPTVSPDGSWVVYVHTMNGVDVLAAADTAGEHWPVKIAEGADFYMQPSWHPNGKRLAWVEWNHPNMPWNGTLLRTASLTTNEKGIHMAEAETWAGGDEVAVQQPVFSPDGTMLAYVSDASGYGEVYVRELGTGQVRRLSSTGHDHAPPAWIQGVRSIAWAPDGASVYALRNEAGVIRLVRYPLAGDAELVDVPAAYEFFDQLTVHTDGSIAAVVSGSRQPPRLVKCDPDGTWHVIKRATAERIPTDLYAPVEPVSWMAADGTEVFGNYYPPTHPEVQGEGLPPALIMIHGGPTSQRTAAFEARNQFFATRGFAVLDVNYRGSTGYGREYMNALFGKWGVLDVEDAVGGAKYLVDAGLAHADKISIMGGSAGGYTVLHSLVEHPGVFASGLSLYGISNLFSLTEGTHKFESRYNDSLLGVLPKDAAIFRERSPIFKVERMQDPVAVFQGADDKVVPKEQADQIVASLEKRKVPHVYHVYEGEGHGWRRAETIEHFYDAALAFLREHVLNP